MIVLPLVEFCEDMHRYSAVISAPENWMPTCNQPKRGGLHVELSPDGSRYVVTYQEKDLVDVVVESDDADQVLERIFSEVTLNMAATRGAASRPAVTDPFQLPENSEDIRKMAVALHVETSQIQEELLGKLSSVWRQHQQVRNAEQLKHINAVFGDE